ncbi:hypothetical protein BCV72DRAFT_293036 [Rhizopus microsporus var. microsporus]|uniref:Uncharacterized protein n=1 Tax=Rhizopus microsporus var. microsporus TaxID=86635 RepID=A0A1X0R0V5_RHIZD|nr:hypothetical protein BCV72DRAFT_293036 [Rhizopus microsporus var. microsporus]
MQRMVDRLFERSLVEKVFISPCVSTFGSIATRDTGFYEQMKDPTHVAGDMKGLLVYISATEKMYLVVFDLASLTTDKDDLLNYNLQGIIVDNIPAKNEYRFFTRHQLLNDPNALNDFERISFPSKDQNNPPLHAVCLFIVSKPCILEVNYNLADLSKSSVYKNSVSCVSPTSEVSSLSHVSTLSSFFVIYTDNERSTRQKFQSTCGRRRKS